MSVYYQNGPEITKITRRGLNSLSMLISRKQYRISAAQLTDKFAWADIYRAWIMACVDYMWFMEHGDPEKEAPQEEQVRMAKLFLEGAEESRCHEFLNRYREMLTRPQYPNVGSSAAAEKICSEIHGKMAGAPIWLRMRVTAVCLLTNSPPEVIFSEGLKWPGALLGPTIAAKYESGVIDVREGLLFELEPGAVSGPGMKLAPRTLRNKYNKVCSVIIRYKGIEHLVKIPPYGFLRAVFSEGSCVRLVSLKGAISCCDAGSAILQKGDDQGSRLFYAHRSGGASRLVGMPLIGPFWDAAADERSGVTGAVVLTAGELYSTVDPGRKISEGDKAPLPIRCYRSGSQWGWLYDDGVFVSNLSGGRDMEGVTAVAEEAGRGLLICRQGQFLDYRSNVERQITEGEFVQAMLGRFLQAGQDECEALSTQFMRWAILDSGEVRQ
jgi:hypothetical protein